ncbi:MAG: peptidylprolyl isomerase [Acetobacteraceae bacterium]|nr:peptidylprolyl isomerase [Acetobacteraceae bacterium]
MLGLLLFGAAPALAQAPAPAAPPADAGALATQRGDNRILAVVNGDVVSRADVINRARLFALNAGVTLPPEILDRLTSQLLRLLIDERLRLQEVQRRRIPVSDADVAEAVRDLESRNGLPSGALRQQLAVAGIQPRVLFDQIRTQIGWSRLLRLQLGPDAQPSDQVVEEAMRAARARLGQPEYLVSEIFIPLDDPRQEAETRRFVEEVIGQLRRGVPFPMVATQFGQSQSAIQGGDMGWVRKEELDDAVAQVIERMPPGAISNPIRVPGGFQIVTLRQKRESGRDMATLLTLRQATFGFTTPLNPEAPTLQQRDALERAQRLSSAARGCDAIEQAARANTPAGAERPSDPGIVRLETVNPPELRSLLGGLTPQRASQPIITPEGVLVIMVCSRETRNLAEMTPEQARAQILRDRVENLSRQLQRDLRRRGQIEMRS